LSVMRLLPSSGRIVSGEIVFDGTDVARLPESALRTLRGRRIAIIFQNAQAALNPLIRVGDQIADVYRQHDKLSRRAAWARAVELIRSVAARLNTTLVIISHDIGLVATICNRMAVMYAGVVMESGTTAQIMQHPANPYTAALLEYVDAEPSDRMPFIPGRVVD